MHKIALEEHFMAPGLEEYEGAVRKTMQSETFDKLERRLQDFTDERIEAMDKAGIDIVVLSQTSPGLQIERNVKTAVRKATEANDFLAERISKNSKRFRGFAHLALQDPTAAAKELERCVKQLGFKGALINGHTNGIYLDEAVNFPFWDKVAELDVPIYLHPADSFDSPHMYNGRKELSGAFWVWTVETGTHALRLVVSGFFEHYPTVKIILGHMGETLPFMLWRYDSRWKQYGYQDKLKRMPSEYIKSNIAITTAGVCDINPLKCSINAIGEDNVMFSTDYPYESALIAGEFIESAELTDRVREKVCYKNAQRILKIDAF